MRHRRRWLLIGCGVAVFLVLSGLLARWLSLENIERDDIIALLQAETRGDEKAMLVALAQCRFDRNCRRNVAVDARRLKRSGSVEILADQSQTAYSLTSAVGVTRVAWKVAGSALPVVQCVKVSRKGNALSGLTITLTSVSLPIHPTTADC
jgi:hypothetical protein